MNFEMEPLKLISESCNDVKIALIVINCPVKVLEQRLEVLWKKSVIKVATDGAANSLKILNEQGHSFIPTTIIGDFDSVTKASLKYFETKGAEIVHAPDQDNTDFTKALKYVIAKTNIDYNVIVAIGGMFESRVDHVFGNFHTLYKGTETTDKNIYLFVDDSVNVVLLPGKHAIQVNTGQEGEWCGIIPVGQPCESITTTGLKWNLTKGSLDFHHGIVSTSNTWDGSNVVTIENSHAVLWTMGVKGTI